jgi:hypothetical protein
MIFYLAQGGRVIIRLTLPVRLVSLSERAVTTGTTCQVKYREKAAA